MKNDFGDLRYEIENIKNDEATEFSHEIFYREDLAVNGGRYSFSVIAKRSGNATLKAELSGIGDIGFTVNGVSLISVKSSGKTTIAEKVYLTEGENEIAIDFSAASSYSVEMIELFGYIEKPTEKHRLSVVECDDGVFVAFYDAINKKARVVFKDGDGESLVFSEDCDDLAVTKLSGGNFVALSRRGDVFRAALVDVNYRDVVSQTEFTLEGITDTVGAADGNVYVIDGKADVYELNFAPDLTHTARQFGVKAKRVYAAANCKNIIFVGLNGKAFLVTD